MTLFTKCFKSFSLISALWASAPIILAQSHVNQTDAPTQNTRNATLTVEINNIANNEGRILIGVFASQADFDNDRLTAEKILSAKIGSVRVNFENLPLGDYAIKALHDEDGDAEMDLSFIGAPSEDYGFSRNAHDPFSQPEWEEAKFTLKSQGRTETINLQ